MLSQARLFTSLESSSGVEVREKGLRQVEWLRSALNELTAQDERSASVFFRPIADQMIYLFYAACLGREAEREDREKGDSHKRAVIELLWRRRIEGAQDEPRSGYLERIAELAGVQLAMVGVGAPREATIVLSNPFLV